MPLPTRVLWAKNGRVLDRKRIGAKLKALRIEQGLHQVEVARLAGISAGTVQTIEWGVRENTLAKIDAVAKALGTTLEALERTPHVDPADPLLAGLNREDLEVARAYHEASSEVRTQARQLLRDRDPQALPALPDSAEARRNARIARLTPRRQQLLEELIDHLETNDRPNEDAG